MRGHNPKLLRMNEYGLTLERWLYAAYGKNYPQNDRGEVYTRDYVNWRDGIDPTDIRASQP